MGFFDNIKKKDKQGFFEDTSTHPDRLTMPPPPPVFDTPKMPGTEAHKEITITTPPNTAATITTKIPMPPQMMPMPNIPPVPPSMGASTASTINITPAQQPAQTTTVSISTAPQSHPAAPSTSLPPLDLQPAQQQPAPITIKHEIHEPNFDIPKAPDTYEEQHIRFHEPMPHIPDAPKMPQGQSAMRQPISRPASVQTSGVPHELPAFPMRQRAPVQQRPAYPRAQQYSYEPPRDAQYLASDGVPHRKIEIDIPLPPPNLRSEISPLELEKLEEKYLGEPSAAPLDKVEPFQRHQNIKKPIFIRTDSYRELLNGFIDIKDKLKSGEETIFRLENLKKNADLEFVEMKKAVEDIQRKLIYIDKSIFES